MSCPCLQSNPIPTCIETLTIGTIGQINIPVVVMITNISTGRVDSFETMSDGDGLVIVDLTDFEINDDTNYKVQVYAASALQGEALTLTVDDNADSCIYFTGQKLNGITITDAVLSTLNNDTQPTGGQAIYHFTNIDYNVPAYIRAIGVDASATIIHIYLGNPNIYTTGEEITVSDVEGSASINTIVIHGAFLLGDPQIIISDSGSLTFYSNGYEFIITASN